MYQNYSYKIIWQKILYSKKFADVYDFLEKERNITVY